jgi:hypothetical protein
MTADLSLNVKNALSPSPIISKPMESLLDFVISVKLNIISPEPVENVGVFALLPTELEPNKLLKN